ncbi:hypothetical protein QO010_004563 [Caulobacter ginsengisoli]|uniref:Uncharacterized protein n=1 Tax=Caulobacter ginsengisoli TaxID=400775 RepID=A0ABU0IXM9_9CAUL|nr:hypothetical protein [Caulobacter ginsengisoli]
MPLPTLYLYGVIGAFSVFALTLFVVSLLTTTTKR